MKSRLGMWKSAYKKDHKIATRKKLEFERRNKIRPQDTVKSNIVKEAIKLLGKSNDQIRCSPTAFVLVRDFIITEIYIDNGHQAGVLLNMTMEEFYKTEKMKDNMYQLMVFHHKESRSGQIRVILKESLFGWLTTYVKNF